jgi:hypothetical protein
MLTQAEADQFMQMAKHFVRPPAMITIPPGADDTYELADPNRRRIRMPARQRKILAGRLARDAPPIEAEVPEQGANRYNSGPARCGRSAAYESGRRAAFGDPSALVQGGLR